MPWQRVRDILFIFTVAVVITAVILSYYGNTSTPVETRPPGNSEYTIVTGTCFIGTDSSKTFFEGTFTIVDHNGKTSVIPVTTTIG